MARTSSALPRGAAYLRGYQTDAETHGTLYLPMHELLQRVEEVPAGEVWVHCTGSSALPVLPAP
jgi:hypothetical protein